MYIKRISKGWCLWASQRSGCGSQSQRLLSLSNADTCCVFCFHFSSPHERTFPNVLFLFSVLQLSFDDIVKYAGVYGEGSSALANLQVCAV